MYSNGTLDDTQPIVCHHPDRTILRHRFFYPTGFLCCSLISGSICPKQLDQIILPLPPKSNPTSSDFKSTKLIFCAHPSLSYVTCVSLLYDCIAEVSSHQRLHPSCPLTSLSPTSPLSFRRPRAAFSSPSSSIVLNRTSSWTCYQSELRRRVNTMSRAAVITLINWISSNNFILFYFGIAAPSPVILLRAELRHKPMKEHTRNHSVICGSSCLSMLWICSNYFEVPFYKNSYHCALLTVSSLCMCKSMSSATPIFRDPIAPILLSDFPFSRAVDRLLVRRGGGDILQPHVPKTHHPVIFVGGGGGLGRRTSTTNFLFRYPVSILFCYEFLFVPA